MSDMQYATFQQFVTNQISNEKNDFFYDESIRIKNQNKHSLSKSIEMQMLIQQWNSNWNWKFIESIVYRHQRHKTNVTNNVSFVKKFRHFDIQEFIHFFSFVELDVSTNDFEFMIENSKNNDVKIESIETTINIDNKNRIVDIVKEFIELDKWTNATMTNEKHEISNVSNATNDNIVFTKLNVVILWIYVCIFNARQNALIMFIICINSNKRLFIINFLNRNENDVAFFFELSYIKIIEQNEFQQCTIFDLNLSLNDYQLYCV